MGNPPGAVRSLVRQAALPCLIAALAYLAAETHHAAVPDAIARPHGPPPSLMGAWEPDSVLTDRAEFVSHGKLDSPETVFLRTHETCDDAFATDSRGRVWKLPAQDKSDDAPTLVAHVGGGLLGGAFDAKGGMYLADATRGLLYIPPDVEYPAIGQARIVSSMAPTDPRNAVGDTLLSTEIRYCNDIGIDRHTGLVYFTDSTRIPPIVGTDRLAQTFTSFSTCHLSGDASGRLLVYVPKTGETHVLATGIRFANGVGVSLDGTHVVVASSSSYTLYKVPTVPADVTFATAPKPIPVEELELFTSAPLPAIPDNLSVDPVDGSVWVAMLGPVPPSMYLSDVAPAALRRVLVRLPHKLRPKSSIVHSILAHFSADGALLSASHDLGRKLGLVTSAERCGDSVLMGSLHGDKALRISLADI